MLAPLAAPSWSRRWPPPAKRHSVLRHPHPPARRLGEGADAALAKLRAAVERPFATLKRRRVLDVLRIARR
ncbi:hypothetical protein [Streptomyces brasiliensis]|uniref:hypothetical protein n=1 Tax=Streptomyces brasiliensis TaxID=1954 RepID=UPI001670C60F|nr:hypothetical protein [Streptomyces brasiliensis]